jgi:hypothetical protein
MIEFVELLRFSGLHCVLTYPGRKSKKNLCSLVNSRRRFAHGIEHPENQEKTKLQEKAAQSELESGFETDR